MMKKMLIVGMLITMVLMFAGCSNEMTAKNDDSESVLTETILTETILTETIIHEDVIH